MILYFVLAEARGTYRNWRGISPNRELASAIGTWACTLPADVRRPLVVRSRRATRPLLGARRSLVEWFLLTTLLLAALRLGARGVQRLLRAGGIHVRGFAVLGVNELGFQLAANIANTPDLGLKLVGFFDDRPPHRVPAVPPEIGKRVGDIQQLIELARAGEIDRIYITLPMRAEERIRRLLTELSDSTASVYIVPDFFVFELLHSCWTDIGGLPVVAVFDHPFYGVDGILKRVTDFVLASLLLVCSGGADAAGGGGDQADLARSGLFPPTALRHGRPRDSRLEIPHDGSPATTDRSSARRRATTRGSRRSADFCGARRSTNCRNCSTCSAAA